MPMLRDMIVTCPTLGIRRAMVYENGPSRGFHPCEHAPGCAAEGRGRQLGGGERGCDRVRAGVCPLGQPVPSCDTERTGGCH